MLDDIRAAVGVLMRRHRQRCGFTLETIEAATARGGHRVPKSTLSDIERGAGPVRIRDLQAAAEACGVPLENVLAEARAMRPADAFPPGLTPRELYDKGRHLHSAGQLQKAAWAFEEAAARAADAPAEQIALYLVAAGHEYVWLNRHVLARHRFERALDIAPDNSDVRVRAFCKMADLLSCDDAWRRALDLVRLARESLPPDATQRLLALVDNTEASALFEGKQYERAIDRAMSAYDRFASVGKQAEAGRQLALCARCHLGLGDHVHALDCALRALDLAEKEGHTGVIIYALLAQAEAHLAAEQAEAARKPAFRAVTMAKRFHMPREEERACAALEEIARRSGLNAAMRSWQRRRARIYTRDLADQVGRAASGREAP